MKMHLVRVSMTLLFLSLSFPASAHLENNNPRASIAFLGPHVITGPAGATMPGLFKVRVIDAQGIPMAGLKVWFYNNLTVGTPENPPPPASPGSFQGLEDPLGVITDADGIATSPPYRIGASSHDVVAGIYGIAGPENSVVGFPPLVAYFHLNYAPPEPPASPPPPPPEIPPLPQGSAAAVSLTAASAPTLASFVLALAILALFHLRKYRLTGDHRR
ncbi:hypothetical protein [Dokdonella immobilis]|uniref:Uncharacterized protein n=1 Tax=Dokdonella immobilis TaxID=578942 RepID=A0A1I4V1A7_9GAMM|nr:hypothetical protein [Dokdonella immobilis]SFM94843.1 hypothetical protein SAMN05216289_10110 [Dokdonella immobilis]